jgi:hypothetical protein
MEKSRKPPAEKSPSAKPVRELVLPIVMWMQMTCGRSLVVSLRLQIYSLHNVIICRSKWLAKAHQCHHDMSPPACLIIQDWSSSSHSSKNKTRWMKTFYLYHMWLYFRHFLKWKPLEL